MKTVFRLLLLLAGLAAATARAELASGDGRFQPIGIDEQVAAYGTFPFNCLSI